MESQNQIRKQLAEQIRSVACFDDEERATQAAMLAWLATTPEFCRTATKPDFPIEHFALFIVCVTPDHQKVLLLEHKKSGLSLTAGGHLEQHETFQQSVTRETKEELGINLDNFKDSPFFLSSLDTKMPTGFHWEPWFIAPVAESTDLTRGADYRAEFAGHRWYTLADAILLGNAHPHFARLVRKLALLRDIPLPS